MSRNNCELRLSKPSLRAMFIAVMLIVFSFPAWGYAAAQTVAEQSGGQGVLMEAAAVKPADQAAVQNADKTVWTPKGYKKYSKLLHCEATAYTHTGNNTSLGFKPYEGIVAVDPRFIPYYTKMYIPGYGFAMAGDTGGDMVHHRIDVFFATLHKALQWGRRNVEIYILEE